MICGASSLVSVGVGFDYESRTCSNRWQVVRCNACDHAQLDPRPADSMLATIYPPTYYSYAMRDTVGGFVMTVKGWLDARKLRRPLRFLGRKVDGYLDVGCGDGHYLKVIERTGVPKHRLFGLELDDMPVARLRGAGYQAWNLRAEEAKSVLPVQSLDLITLFHVIEHVADPRAVIRSLSELLRPGAMLMVETPNLDSLDWRLFRSSFWGGYHFPRHWHFFTASGLARLLSECGLEVVDTRYQTGHSFWLFSLHHWLRYRSGRRWPRLANAVHPLKSLLPLAVATGFDLIRSRLGYPTSAVLITARRPD